MTQEWVQINGIAKVVALFRSVTPEWRRKWMAGIEDSAPWLVKLVENYEFTFLDLISLDRDSLYHAFCKVDNGEWLKAFRLTPRPLRQHILGSLPESRRKVFIEQYNDLPKLKRAEILRAQIKISIHVRDQLRAGTYKQFCRAQVDTSTSSESKAG